ncbi:hypothetical protein ACM46_12880 [Chryseobacterium angstadtii]|uniref:Uncharacterized protein n=1 Tax=Chryseobacterium angstadtii TaxID=558151 RepID=A0A0J7IGH0_9FLAO|nr:hypothetical protein [Chryseobacterium angstadtii]KMQ65081.1 hypothetical protein ACM46_12880 [Chryseobacterium angstadtii]
MYPISKKIHIGRQAFVAKNSFSNDEITHSATTEFTCCDCGRKNTIEITPYQSGFPIFQMYHENKVVSGSELLKNKIVTETSKGMIHFGELTVQDLPTLYFGTQCQSCFAKYICVFGYGEKQPGLTLLHISGVWKYEEAE